MKKTEKFKALPVSVQNVLNLGIEITKPKKVVLFGSRSRGDHRDKSDYDIAFFSINQPMNWATFLGRVSEEPISLRKIDLVQFEEMNQEYQMNICKEGLNLYEA